MRFDIDKLKEARERRAMTQEKVAADARVDVRTVQRAEAGADLRQDTVADIAAALGVPHESLVDVQGTAAPEVPVIGDTFGPGLVLRRATKGRQVIELLEMSELAKLECDADPTEKTLEVLKSAIRLIEGMIPDPWSESARGALSFVSLVDRIERIAEVNKVLEELEREGLALHYGQMWGRAKMPQVHYEGMFLPNDSEVVQAARFLISSNLTERVTVEKLTTWPVNLDSLKSNTVAEDLDDDVPF